MRLSHGQSHPYPNFLTTWPHSLHLRKVTVLQMAHSEFRYVALCIPSPRKSGLEVLRPCCSVWFRNQRAEKHAHTVSLLLSFPQAPALTSYPTTHSLTSFLPLLVHAAQILLPPVSTRWTELLGQPQGGVGEESL